MTITKFKQDCSKKYLILSAVLISLLFGVFTLLRPTEFIFIETEGSHKNFEIFQFDQTYSEDHKVLSSGDLGLQTKKLFLAGHSFKYSKRFRVDLLNASALKIGKIVHIQRNLFTSNYQIYELKDVLLGLNNLVEADRQFNVTGNDPWLDIDLERSTPISIERSYNSHFIWLIILLIVSLISIFAYFKLCSVHFSNYHLSPILALFLVILAFNLYAPKNHGPDENMHYNSVFWYIDNDRPPSLYLKDQTYRHEIWLNSYVIGASGDLTYLLAAKLSYFISGLNQPSVYQVRLAQFILVLIGLGLILHCFGVQRLYPILIFFGLLPQVSYITTYVNGDIQSLVYAYFAFLLIFSAAKQQKFINNFLKVFIAVFLIFNIKSNYIVVLPFCLYFLYRFLIRQDRSYSIKMILLLLLASPVILYRRLFNYLDQLLSGKTYALELLDISNKIINPNDPQKMVKVVYDRLNSDNPVYNWFTFDNPNWFLSSAYSFFGNFGYMSHKIPFYLFLISSGIFIFLIASYIKNIKKFLLVLSAITLATAASLHYSFFYDYQPQGRYLFPFIIIISFYLYAQIAKYRKLLSGAALASILSLIWFALVV